MTDEVEGAVERETTFVIKAQQIELAFLKYYSTLLSAEKVQRMISWRQKRRLAHLRAAEADCKPFEVDQMPP